MARPNDILIYSLQNAHTGRCIDDSLQFGLRSFPCNGMTYQKWEMNIKVVLGIAYRHPCNAETNRCMDDSQQFGLRSFEMNPLDYQLFNLWGV